MGDEGGPLETCLGQDFYYSSRRTPPPFFSGRRRRHWTRGALFIIPHAEPLPFNYLELETTASLEERDSFYYSSRRDPPPLSFLQELETTAASDERDTVAALRSYFENKHVFPPDELRRFQNAEGGSGGRGGGRV